MGLEASTLYHISPAANRHGILTYGVDPAMSRGKKMLSWWIEHDNLLWALAHTSARHRTPVSDLDAWMLDTKGVAFKATCWRGVWTLDVMAYVVTMYPLVVGILNNHLVTNEEYKP